jgi:hypothetical protein
MLPNSNNVAYPATEENIAPGQTLDIILENVKDERLESFGNFENET